jgi:hypothetical protein
MTILDPVMSLIYLGMGQHLFAIHQSKHWFSQFLATFCVSLLHGVILLITLKLCLHYTVLWDLSQMLMYQEVKISSESVWAGDVLTCISKLQHSAKCCCICFCPIMLWRYEVYVQFI